MPLAVVNVAEGGMPVVTVAAGGLPVTEASNGCGLAITEAVNGFGRAITRVEEMGARQTLAANRTYFVRADGNDANNGLANTVGGAFLTIQKAIDTVADTIDLASFDVTIQVADGTYTGNIVVYGPWTGRGNVTLHGNVTTPANCILAPTSGNVLRVGRSLGTLPTNTNAKLIIGGFKTITSNSNGLNAEEGSALLIDAPMEFGAHGTGVHIQAARRSEVFINTNYTISGGAARHWLSLNQSTLICTSRALTFTGSPVFSTAFATAQRVSIMVANGNTFSGAVGAGTKKYETLVGAAIDVAGAGANYFPGDIAGTDDGTGIYV